jgi:hypothetical protein
MDRVTRRYRLIAVVKECYCLHKCNDVVIDERDVEACSIVNISGEMFSSAVHLAAVKFKFWSVSCDLMVQTNLQPPSSLRTAAV